MSLGLKLNRYGESVIVTHEFFIWCKPCMGPGPAPFFGGELCSKTVCTYTYNNSFCLIWICRSKAK
jgi:hypothetical protein